ncbi:MAG TPA: tetratricopeptide repeat protein [Oscillospiraceae bacterium]|nr:tetratricopeptide repeat protein [Oscillospiraceae bacterium]
MRLPHSGDKKSTAAAYNRQGALMMQRGRFREASFHLLSAVVCDPDCWPAFFNLGNCWVKISEYEAAIWAYEQAVRNCTEYGPLFLNLGVAHCQYGQVEQALPYLEQAWRLEPERAACSAALGYVCYKLGELGLSWHWYDKALRLQPEKNEYKESIQYIGDLISVAAL